MALRAAMVLTTIADPVLLEGCCANFTAGPRALQFNYICWMAACMRAWVTACRGLATV